MAGANSPKPDSADKVFVIVHERPNKVWVICNDVIHRARWRTTESGDGLLDVDGNRGLLRAAMLAWGGQNETAWSFVELERFSQGWGAWDD